MPFGFEIRDYNARGFRRDPSAVVEIYFYRQCKYGGMQNIGTVSTFLFLSFFLSFFRVNF